MLRSLKSHESFNFPLFFRNTENHNELSWKTNFHRDSCQTRFQLEAAAPEIAKFLIIFVNFERKTALDTHNGCPSGRREEK